MKLKHYVIRCPGFLYAMDEHARSKEEAVMQFRIRWGMTRMPPGYSIKEKK